MHIKELFSNKTYEVIHSRRTEKGDLLSSFHQRINEDRTGKYKKLSMGYVSSLLSVYDTSDLYCLWKKCEQSNSFGACFWYHVKPKKEKVIHTS